MDLGPLQDEHAMLVMQLSNQFAVLLERTVDQQDWESRRKSRRRALQELVHLGPSAFQRIRLQHRLIARGVSGFLDKSSGPRSIVTSAKAIARSRPTEPGTVKSPRDSSKVWGARG
eukprot:scaffold48_cov311-Pinguiococcus_pyrenoidosus.AAC.154